MKAYKAAVAAERKGKIKLGRKNHSAVHIEKCLRLYKLIIQSFCLLWNCCKASTAAAAFAHAQRAQKTRWANEIIIGKLLLAQRGAALAEILPYTVITAALSLSRILSLKPLLAVSSLFSSVKSLNGPLLALQRSFIKNNDFFEKLLY